MKQDKKVDPFDYMVMKRKVVLRAISGTSTLPEAWNLLIENIPEIESVIRFNTFKVYARILVKFGQIVNEKEAELGKVRQQVEALKNTADTTKKPDSAPKQFHGWGVQHNRGYYRLFKKLAGKVRWIYIGKKWSDSIAAEKISDFRLDKNS